MGILIIVLFIGMVLLTGGAFKTASFRGGNVQGDVQKVVIGFKNFNYFPNTINVDVNRPVRIYLDESVSGCYRSFTIKELGVAKYLSSPEEYVEFTPTETGTYRFACSMGMGTGTLIVR